MKKILLATRPLTPPWDEASKNFAYFLAKSIKTPELQIHILTVKSSLLGKAGGPLKELSEKIIQHPIFPAYDATQAGHSFSQKALLSSYLFTQSHKYDIVHYLFTPTTLNSKIIQFGNRLQGVIPAKAGVQGSPTSDLQQSKDSGILDSRLRKNDMQKDCTTKNTFKTIQTIATLREDLYGPTDWKKMFFADKLVVYSDYSKTRLEAAGFANIECIYPGIDLNLYSPQLKDEVTMKHFNIAPDDFVLSYFGEYARLGATDMLVEMLTKHLKNNTQKKIKFILACRVKNNADQKKKDEVVAKLTQAGVIDSIRFTDTWKDMPKLYNMTDIVLFPVENMRGKFDIPLVIIEGYACGKPVIVTNLPIFKEFTNSDISVIIPSGDGDALWTTIESLMHDETKKNTLGKSARAFVEQHFDLRNTTKEYEQLYTSL